MLKRKIDAYIRNYYETTRNALLITGARQIGKTYSIRQFGKSFKSFVENNLSIECNHTEFVAVFFCYSHSVVKIVCNNFRASYKRPNTCLF